MIIPVHKDANVGFNGGVFFTVFPSFTNTPFPVVSGCFFPKLFIRPPKMIATQFPSTVAGAIFVSTSAASTPSAWEYMAERGTVPAVIPPLVIGTPI